MALLRTHSMRTDPSPQTNSPKGALVAREFSGCPSKRRHGGIFLYVDAIL